MRKILLLSAFVLLLAEVRCPEHGYATCLDTGVSKPAVDGKPLHKYHCSCGDEYWVRK